MSNYSAKLKDVDGNSVEVNWTEKLWQVHLNKHPEIQDHDTATKLIGSVIENPCVVMEGCRPGSKEVTRGIL